MEMEHGHSPEAIAERLASGPDVSYLRDWIYGGIDGAVTTFAIVAGAVGAGLSARIILVLGFANLIADGFSMAAANYSGTKAEADDYKRLREMEERHLAVNPDGEREEIRQIFERKGFSGPDLSEITRLVTSRRDHWIETMMAEEFGLAAIQRSPMMSALATFAAFVVCGAVPLVPFIFGMSASATIASSATAATFFAIGAAKARWSTQSWWLSGLETTAIGMTAAGLAYAVGHLIDSLV